MSATETAAKIATATATAAKTTQLYILGEKPAKCLIPSIYSEFPEHKHLSPISELDVANFIAIMAEQTVNSKSIAILIINGHGNDKLTHITFPKYRIETTKITNHLLQLNTCFEDFRCVLLVETCFSGFFNQSGCDALITSTDRLHVSRGHLLIMGFNELLENKGGDAFTPNDIYKIVNYDSKDSRDDANWNKLSRAQLSQLIWDHSFSDEIIAKKHNMSMEVLKKGFPQIFGLKSLQLKPVIHRKYIEEAITKSQKETGKVKISSKILLNNLNTITNKSHTYEEFYTAMMLRQLNSQHHCYA